MDSQKAKNLNPVVLAFVGDAVYSLFVREKLVFSSDYKTGELNKLGAFVELLNGFEVTEIARTGITGLLRGFAELSK
jgi:hypothetical protein